MKLRPNRHTSAAMVATLALSGACQRAAQAPTPEPLPTISVERIAPLPVMRTAPTDSAVRRPEKRITLSASNADVRALLIGIAQAGDIDLVLSPDVKGRASVNLKDVPASEALRIVLAEAGLGINSPQGIILAWDPVVVFYDLPVNIDRVSADAIMRRYGVGREVAEWIVRSRAPAPMP